ncbi:MAG: phosphoribosylglycinamide formyltransferase [Planctomycetota bacterium]|jgi:formyltetrahydrofolate-dependent phosphoribosylglycinamide formyltransferase|nr:phosphoribosylglycinamide formyltransferase [Planctomycetota bacterium]
MPKILKIAVLFSGAGTTLANLLERQDDGRLLGSVELAISSNPRAGGLQVAERAGVRTAVVDSRKFRLSAREGEVICDWRGMSRELDRLIGAGEFDLVCMAGFLCYYVIPKEMAGRVINIHPSLLPMFCGQGMYGPRVHEAVVKSGVRVTGCTVHFADSIYDNGPIILQRCCPVYSGDPPEEVASRVFTEECEAYPAAINLIADGRVHYSPGLPVHVDGDREIERFFPYDA